MISTIFSIKSSGSNWFFPLYSAARLLKPVLKALGLMVGTFTSNLEVSITCFVAAYRSLCGDTKIPEIELKKFSKSVHRHFHKRSSFINRSICNKYVKIILLNLSQIQLVRNIHFNHFYIQFQVILFPQKVCFLGSQFCSRNHTVFFSQGQLLHPCQARCLHP